MTSFSRSALVLAGLGAVLILGGTPAFADVSLVSQNRSVSATGNGVTHSQTAPDFAPFHGNVTAGAGGLADSAGTATQDSTISGTQLSYSARVSGWHSSGSGTSTFQIVFDVAATQTYDAVITHDGNLTFYRATLTGPNGVVFDHDSDFTSHFGGTLTTGQYTLTSNIHVGGIGSNFTQYNGGSFSITFVPAPGASALLVGGLVLAQRRRR